MAEVLGAFEVIGVLGSGGQATTLRAQASDGTVVALKVYDDEAASTARDEARLLASIDDPRVPSLVEVFESNWRGQPVTVIAQEFVEGRSLQDVIDGGYFVDEDVIESVARQLLDLLQELHTREPAVLHRDIKPANIIITDSGRMVLVDFGGGMLVDEEGDVIGTTGYSAPEQYFGTASPRSDLYGVGATLLHLASRRHPSDFPMSRLRYELDGRLWCGPWLFRLVEALLEPDETERPVDAHAAISLLDAEPEASGGVIVERSSDQLRVTISPGARRAQIIASGATLALAALITAFLSVWFGLLLAGMFGLLIAWRLLRTEVLTVTAHDWTVRRSWLGIVAREEHGPRRPGFDFRGQQGSLVDFEGRLVTAFAPFSPRADKRMIRDSIRAFVAAEQGDEVVLAFDEAPRTDVQQSEAVETADAAVQ